MSGDHGVGAKGSAGNLPLEKDLLFLVHQFLKEEGLHETAHSMERDSQIFFDLKYFDELIVAGKWAEADWYLRGFFVDVQDNRFGLKLVFEVYKQQYLEALYRHDMLGAHDILQTKFRSILSTDQDIYQELTQLFFLDNFRAHPRLKEWDNPEKARATLRGEMRKVVLRCPELMDKLDYPAIPRSRMSSLLLQSANWQHYLCEKKLTDPVWTTLLKDHDCSELMRHLPSTSTSSLLRQPQNFGPLPPSTNVTPSTNVPMTMSSSAGPSIIDIRGRLATYVRSVRNVGESSQQTEMCLDSQHGDSIVPAKRICAAELSTSQA